MPEEDSLATRQGDGTLCLKAYKKIAKDRKVIPDPIDDRKFQE